MIKRIRLTLMIGPMVPVPVPREVLEVLTSIDVTTPEDGPSVFQLSFALDTRSLLNTLFLLSGGRPIPLIRVVIVATVNGIARVLMDGVMTNHEVSPGSEPGQTTLTVTGEDLSRVMDYVDFSGTPYPAVPAWARVLLILRKYAGFGIRPMVIPPRLTDAPLPLDQVPQQKGKDLEYIKQLAKEVGYVFYIDPGPAPGVSTAYWGPEIRVGRAQPALNVNMDAHTNVESLNFNFDSESKKLPVLPLRKPTARAPIPIPVTDISSLKTPLGLVSPIPKQIKLITKAAKLSLSQAILLGQAEAAQTADVVSASGELDVLRYGRVLKARKLVGVRGAGPAFDGLYYVKSVTHKIKRGEYKQSFKLGRDGLMSARSRVRP